MSDQRKTIEPEVPAVRQASLDDFLNTKKAAARPKPPGGRVKRLTFVVTEELHAQVKMQSIKAGVSMSEYATRLFEKALAEGTFLE
jgi:predicted HicB family RNase H-like nuclease